MGDAVATLTLQEDSGNFSPNGIHWHGGGAPPFKMLAAHVDITGDYTTNGIPIPDELDQLFGEIIDMTIKPKDGYFYDYDATNKKIKMYTPAAAHTHTVALDGGATNYPAQNWIPFHGLQTITTSATKYLGAAGTEQATAAACTAFVIPKAGFLRALYVDLVTAPGAGKTYSLTVNVNGVDSAMTVSVTETNKTGSDTTHNAIAVAAGDRVVLKSVNDNGSAAGLAASILYEITAGAIGVLTTDAASGSGSATGAAGEVANGTSLSIEDVFFIVLGR